MELAPAFATAWFALGAIRDVWAIAPGQSPPGRRRADPDDYHGARLQLARLGTRDGTPAMTATYVRRLFDQQAASFDETLVERLDYHEPAILHRAVRDIAGRRCGSARCSTLAVAPDRRLRFGRMWIGSWASTYRRR